MEKSKLPEPWLRGTLSEVATVQRAILHALELAREDLELWCGDLSDTELSARPADLAPVAFHIRHIARGMDRLLTYAEGMQLNPDQIAAMKSEMVGDPSRDELFTELRASLDSAAERVRAFPPESFSEKRGVGRQQMPTTVAGLLVHVADHTQRHVGQAITTAKLVKNARKSQV
jgi:uncharacterized damage-inducible protein DinB